MLSYRCRVVYCLYFILVFSNFTNANKTGNSGWRNFRLSSQVSTTIPTTKPETTTISLTTTSSTTLATTSVNTESSTSIITTKIIESIKNLVESNNVTTKQEDSSDSQTVNPDQPEVTKPPSLVDSLLEWLSNIFNKSTLILTLAFIAGLLLIITIILIGICCYRSFARRRRSKPPKITISNPAYDKIPKNPQDFLADTDSINSRKRIYNGDLEVKIESPNSNVSSTETIRLLDIKPEDQKQLDENLTIKSSSSSASLDSVIEKTPKTPAAKSSLSSLTKKLTTSSKDLDRSNLLDDDETSLNKSVKSRFTPNKKTNLQKSKEEQVARRSLYNRTKSENEDTLPYLPPVPPNDKAKNRISIGSSTSSIVPIGPLQPIDFTQIETGVDQLLSNTKLINQSTSSINVNHNSVHNSLSDIYMQAIREKREQEKTAKMQKKIEITESKIGISMNPNPVVAQNVSVSNLNNDTSSIKTYGSEKSCY